MKSLTLSRSLVLLALASMGILACAQSPAVRALRDLSLKPQMRRDVFDASLTELAARPSASFAGPDAALEMELARIGRDRQVRPDVYERTIRRFTRVGQNTRGGGALHPLPEEKTESYRLVWEYLLLLPFVPGDVGLTAARALEALSDIADDSSVPVLVEKFDKDMDYTTGSSSVGQRRVLQVLQCIPTQSSLDAILECAAAAERQLLKLDAKIAAITDPNERINASLDRWKPLDEAARIGAPGADPRWANVLASYRPKDADPLKAQALTQARRAKRGL